MPKYNKKENNPSNEINNKQDSDLALAISYQNNQPFYLFDIILSNM